MSEIRMYEAQKFPSPCGVGVVSCMLHWAGRLASFRPLAGCGLFRPIAYTCGVYGWNFDVYNVYGKTICTGYRGMPGRKANNEAAYEEKARAISDNYDLSWEVRRDRIESLLKEFCEQA